MLDVLEVIAPFKQFSKLREFMQNKLPAGFPVKIGINLELSEVASSNHFASPERKNLQLLLTLWILFQKFRSFQQWRPKSRFNSSTGRKTYLLQTSSFRGTITKIRIASPTYDTFSSWHSSTSSPASDAWDMMNHRVHWWDLMSRWPISATPVLKWLSFSRHWKYLCIVVSCGSNAKFSVNSVDSVIFSALLGCVCLLSKSGIVKYRTFCWNVCVVNFPDHQMKVVRRCNLNEWPR